MKNNKAKTNKKEALVHMVPWATQNKQNITATQTNEDFISVMMFYICSTEHKWFESCADMSTLQTCLK